MNLPTKAYEEFKLLYKKKYGITLSDESTREHAQRLITLFALSQRRTNVLP